MSLRTSICVGIYAQWFRLIVRGYLLKTMDCPNQKILNTVKKEFESRVINMLWFFFHLTFIKTPSKKKIETESILLFCCTLYTIHRYITTCDESKPSWHEPGLKLNNFRLGLACDVFHSARKFPY